MDSTSQASTNEETELLRTLIGDSRQKLLTRLQELQTNKGYWEGRLSTSALSTATAVSALCLMRNGAIRAKSVPPIEAIMPIGRERESGKECIEGWNRLIDRGMDWLVQHQNSDGGFGDTDRSHSNIATSYLVIAAIHLAGRQDDLASCLFRATAYVNQQGGWDGLRKRYGKDKTFVVPILTNCALAGLIDWQKVSPLPFEAAALPQSWYRFAKMPVVSYAIPALVAIGQVRHRFAPSKNPIVRWIRQLARRRTLEVLRRMQPQSGGYLEAVPLTSFVLMSLAAMELDALPVAKDCVRFLEDSVLPDGSWPIDTNLATWVTSLTIRAVEIDASSEKEGEQALLQEDTIRWLIRCQHRHRHPFTGADPGGWGWTNLSGAVPDADDTPAALLALWQWRSKRTDVSTDIDQEIAAAIPMAIEWLLGLQNRDGGWPTFCRGWGQLPFDRSGNDLTAHAIRAFSKWRSDPLLGSIDSTLKAMNLPPKIDRAVARGLRYLLRGQADDGSWLPLWFGNQDHDQEDNPVYGTSRVLMALAEVRSNDDWRELEIDTMIERGTRYLIQNQNGDGGWGGGSSVIYEGSAEPKSIHGSPSSPRELEKMVWPEAKIDQAAIFRNSKVANNRLSSIEESAVALEALLACSIQSEFDESIMRGLRFLGDSVQKGWCETSWPIGFYFAKLWYYEKMYPIVFPLAALQLARKRWNEYR